ncbi:MAG: hypothetical protein DRJ61_00880 [Acidobacteria bacterium]|nr:MAG: hypothetical protein DRJ61_00880 [Acidobacteriota bacterium]
MLSPAFESAFGPPARRIFLKGDEVGIGRESPLEENDLGGLLPSAETRLLRVPPRVARSGILRNVSVLGRSAR